MIPLTQQYLLSINLSLQTMAYLLLGIIILLLFSAFFSASETAFSTTNSIRMRKLADENVKGARKALNIIENYDKTLSTILVGNNLVNIANTTICAYLFSVLIANPTLSNITNTVVMTIIILIFGEILPKSFVKINPEKNALRFAGFMYFLIRFLTPVTFLFHKAQQAMMKKVREEEVPTVTEDDLEGIIDTMEEEGVLNSADADLFMGVLEINEKTVYDIMTPRVDVVAVSIDDAPAVINQIFVDNGYSRLPIYENDKDHMIGILNYKDYFKAYLAGEAIDLKTLMTHATYVAENMKVKELIRIMQKEKRHLAIVLDEHGGTSGIVTMEDALEEMVGEIYDEHDQSETVKSIKKLQENTYEIDAEVQLADLFEELEIEHMPDTEYTSVGGYLYELAENLPLLNQVIQTTVLDEQPNDEGEYEVKRVKLTFTLKEVENNRIRKVVLNTETLLDGPQEKADNE